MSVATAAAGRAPILILAIEEPDFTISSNTHPITKNPISVFDLARFPFSFPSPLEPPHTLRHIRCARERLE
jgi:hypothetical protein